MPAPAGLIAIVGATATGKTALAISLAQSLGGEIINADSRQFYRGMDIGTAKPTLSEQAAVPHHLIDIAAPNETVALGDYIQRVQVLLSDIWARGRQPILVGGTGQYIFAVVEGWRVPRVPPDRILRAELEQLVSAQGIRALRAELRALDPVSADVIDPRNVRRLIRAIEVSRATGRPFSAWQSKDQPAFQTTMLGLSMERARLFERADARVDRMIADGLLDEVRKLNGAGFACDLSAMSAIGYRQMCEFLGGGCTFDQAVDRMKMETHRLVRMQNTWFKRTDPRITWLNAEAPDLVSAAIVTVSL